jgi:hypothetical protein
MGSHIGGDESARVSRAPLLRGRARKGAPSFFKLRIYLPGSEDLTPRSNLLLTPEADEPSVETQCLLSQERTCR